MSRRIDVSRQKFRAWLETFDPDAEFYTWSCDLCPLAVYLHHTEKARVEVGSDNWATIGGIGYEMPEWTAAFVHEFDGPVSGARPRSAAEAIVALESI